MRILLAVCGAASSPACAASSAATIVVLNAAESCDRDGDWAIASSAAVTSSVALGESNSSSREVRLGVLGISAGPLHAATLAKNPKHKKKRPQFMLGIGNLL